MKIMSKRSKRDERSSSILAPNYRKGFYILAIEIAFDLYTRFNHFAQANGNNSGGIWSLRICRSSDSVAICRNCTGTQWCTQ